MPVTVYYESFCPDSRAFITKQLTPAYNDIKELIELKFVPFGKSQSKDTKGDLFECHHGQKECAGNKLHSCGLENLQGNADAQVKFVNCQMKAFESDPSGKTCVEESGADWSAVSKCIEGDAGKQLQLRAETDTQTVDKPWPKNIPTITYNNVSLSQVSSFQIKLH